MKKLICSLVMVLALICAPTAFAGSQEKKKIEKVEFVTDIHCNSCARKIEGSIPYEKGIKDVSVDVGTKRVIVSYDPQKTDTETIVKAFDKIKVKAEPETSQPQ